MKHTARQARKETQPSGWVDGLLQRVKLKAVQAPAVAELRQHGQELDGLDAQAEADFQATENFLKEKNLPPEILQRHADAVQTFKAKRAELKRLMQTVEEADNQDDTSGRQTAVDEVATFLEHNQKGKTHTLLDPKNLPFRTPDSKVRKPKETEQEFHASLFKPEPIRVAALGNVSLGLPNTTPSATPTPEDLAETEDVQLTQAIKDQAAALHHNPVEIYNWVRNTVAFLPTYGSIQGADLTLQNQRGNAFDTASLLIALLRASGIPARYVYGTIQLPADQVMNWVGGVQTPEAAQDLLGQGGIPNTGMISGGKIAAIKLEHVWVEAYVDYVPSRGAVNRQGDTWVPMDGSFKQYSYQGNLDLRQESPFNAQAFIDTFNSGTAGHIQEGWISGVNVPAAEAAYQQAGVEIQSWLDRVLNDGKDWRHLHRIGYTAPAILLGTLPYSVVARGASYSAIPDSQRLSFRFDLYASELDRSEANPVLSFRSSLPALKGRRLTLGFAPATDADWTTIKSYLPDLPQGQAFSPADLPSTLPGYLIRLTAVLLADDQPISRGGTFSMGQDVYSAMAISRLSGGFHEALNSHVAGEFLAIGIDLQGYSPSQLLKSSQRTTVSVLHQVTKAYFHRRDTYLDYLRLLGQAVAFPAPSFGLFGTGLTPRYRFNIPYQVKLNSVQIDVDAGAQTLAALDNNPAARIRLMEQLGQAMSALEHEIPESHLANDQYPGQGISSIKALTLALGGGQRIYRINQDNLENALARINHSEAVTTDIRNAVNAGRIVVIHERPVMIGNWTGAGYVLTDPVTGAGAYRISGGLNGGAMESEVGEALTLAGLSVLTSAGVALMEFAIPAAHADEGICGEAEQERVPVSSFAVNLIFAVVVGIIIGIATGGVGGAVVVALIALFGSTAAVAQARRSECYVYYIGNTDAKGRDISQLKDHILQAIDGINANNKIDASNLTYFPATVKAG